MSNFLGVDKRVKYWFPIVFKRIGDFLGVRFYLLKTRVQIQCLDTDFKVVSRENWRAPGSRLIYAATGGMVCKRVGHRQIRR